MQSLTLNPSVAEAVANYGKRAIADEQPRPIAPASLNLMQRYNHNPHGRDFVCGDLHGCRAMFDALLVAIDFDESRDRMFCTGDLIDRGPDSLGCLELLKKPWFHSVAGNHEQMLLRAATEPNFNWQWWIQNGGAWASMLTKDELLDAAAAVADLPLSIIVGSGPTRFNIIHAEFSGTDEALEDMLENITTETPVPDGLMWGRDLVEGKVDPAEHEGLSTTFVGHTVTSQVGRIGSHIFIDTGAYLAHRRTDHETYGLTVIEPKTARIWRSKPE